MCARMEMGRSTPQHIQQMVMREYCKQKNITYLLAAVEYQMRNCTMILDAVLGDLEHLEGIIFYSIYQFPQSREKRMKMYEKIIEAGSVIHVAVEGYIIKNWEDALRVEDSIIVGEAIAQQSQSDFTYLKQWDLQNAAN